MRTSEETRVSAARGGPDGGASSVLSTMNDDGSRRWMRPRVSPGRFLAGRRIAAYLLIAIFAALPWIEVGGNPAIQLDIVNRRYHILGRTFLPTDTVLLALLMVGLFLGIFWVTALFGRVWCGWACPQTVYLEFVFRPIERFFDGTGGAKRRRFGAWSAPLKYGAYLICSLLLAHTFLSYFVSWESLGQWVVGSPARHMIAFIAALLVTAAMMFDFAYFREQVCVVACPYGRLQSVLLDRHSTIIRYDEARGEPRGAKRSDIPLRLVTDGDSPRRGDCVDCRLCVTTCPTGIDIRHGLQMECVGCAQCIDACDAVMKKVGRPTGLIRYSSQAAMAGERFRILRARVVAYPVVLCVLGALFVVVLLSTGVADVTVLRGLGQPFSVLSDGRISNTARLIITNRTDQAAEFHVKIEGVSSATLNGETTIHTTAEGTAKSSVQIVASPDEFARGRAPARLIVEGPSEFRYVTPFVLLGPSSTKRGTP